MRGIILAAGRGSRMKHLTSNRPKCMVKLQGKPLIEWQLDALREFDRILYPSGVFSALWNPRLTDRSPIESKVEELLKEKYQLKSRISSGLGGITQELHQLLRDCGIFRSVEYADAVDVVRRSAVEYIGAWRSVNDVQAQLGKYAFERFIEDVERIVSEYSYVEVHYLTRVWIARK